MGRSKNVWRAYMLYSETGFIERGGTIACKVVSSLNLPREEMYSMKPEFVSEHQGRSAFLLGLILMHYPELFDQSTWFTQLMFELCHDVGEIKHGDILDDGSRLGSDALLGMRQDEEELMDEFFLYFPSHYSIEMQDIGPKFESYKDRMPLFLKMVEKLDAVLYQLFLYNRGTCGDVKAKKPHPSGRDIRFAKILGTSRAIDVWTLHLRVAVKHAPEDLKEPLRKILTAAFKDTYRSMPECMTIDVTDIPLDAPEDHIKSV